MERRLWWKLGKKIFGIKRLSAKITVPICETVISYSVGIECNLVGLRQRIECLKRLCIMTHMTKCTNIYKPGVENKNLLTIAIENIRTF